MAGEVVPKGKKQLTDADVQKKSIKLIVIYLRKKMDPKLSGMNYIEGWIDDMEELLEKEDFVRSEYIDMRKRLNEAIEMVFDKDMRSSLRNSWYSYGKALEKKAPKEPEN
ncbi:MAG: hypothetical protein LBI03_05825 [Clostridiales bacterium]|nr:hypothetical protein [Clostridiales bacterium]